MIQPLLSALGEGPIIEIGAGSGETTAKLAVFAMERGITVHSIDPSPEFDVADHERRFDGCLHFHRKRSYDALEEIGPAAAVLVDGDHNWYTVHGELTRLERVAAGEGRPFPLTLLHDVEWPYARRDMYYEPDAVPEELRRPWARRGIQLGDPRLVDEPDSGLNPQFANAIEEGGPKNGVLTAVEDFIAGPRGRFRLRIVRGEFGLGVLVSDDLLDSSPPLAREWARICSPEFLEAETERLSAAATQSAFELFMARAEMARLKRPAGQGRI